MVDSRNAPAGHTAVEKIDASEDGFSKRGGRNEMAERRASSG
jgi:hypothetical protein